MGISPDQKTNSLGKSTISLWSEQGEAALRALLANLEDPLIPCDLRTIICGFMRSYRLEAKDADLNLLLREPGKNSLNSPFLQIISFREGPSSASDSIPELQNGQYGAGFFGNTAFRMGIGFAGSGIIIWSFDGRSVSVNSADFTIGFMS